MKVDLFIVGGQKCGTTALHSFLSGHPDIIACEPKETDFFCSEIKWKKGIKYYHSFFRHKPFLAGIRGFHFLDASPAYSGKMVYELTAERIFDYNPNAKIIFLVRDPVKRAYSAWNMYKGRYFSNKKEWWVKWYTDRIGELPPNLIRRKEEEFIDFDLYVKNEINALEAGTPIECPILENGKYIFMIEKYVSVFGNNCFVLMNEEMKKNTEKFLLELCRKLGLKDHDWESSTGKKIFQGEYENSITVTAQELLREYYLTSNKIIAEKFAISYL